MKTPDFPAIERFGCRFYIDFVTQAAYEARFSPEIGRYIANNYFVQNFFFKLFIYSLFLFALYIIGCFWHKVSTEYASRILIVTLLYSSINDLCKNKRNDIIDDLFIFYSYPFYLYFFIGLFFKKSPKTEVIRPFPLRWVLGTVGF